MIFIRIYRRFLFPTPGGSGLVSNKDKRVELDEWLAGYAGVNGYGFAALKSIENKKQAREAFAKMDDNGGGMILLDEWCWFIKEAEGAAKTPVGVLLVGDESGGVGKPAKLAAGKAVVTVEDSKKGSKEDKKESKNEAAKAKKEAKEKAKTAKKGAGKESKKGTEAADEKKSDEKIDSSY